MKVCRTTKFGDASGLHGVIVLSDSRHMQRAKSHTSRYEFIQSSTTNCSMAISTATDEFVEKVARYSTAGSTREKFPR